MSLYYASPERLAEIFPDSEIKVTAEYRHGVWRYHGEINGVAVSFYRSEADLCEALRALEHARRTPDPT